jgi:hypothetical protein
MKIWSKRHKKKFNKIKREENKKEKEATEPIFSSFFATPRQRQGLRRLSLLR